MTTQLEANAVSKSSFERTARDQCADLLRVVREQFAPSGPIEALVILGFMRGAGWALDVKTPQVPETALAAKG